MNDFLRDLDGQVLRYVLGELSPNEARAFRARLDTDALLRAEVARVSALRDALHREQADSFAPYFSDRVVRRLMEARKEAESLYVSLRWIFARTSVAAAALAVFIGAYNVAQFGDLAVASSLWDALFGLPSADFIDAMLSGPM